VNILYELELHCVFCASKTRDGSYSLFTVLLVQASSVERVNRPWVFIFTAHCHKISVCDAYKREALNKSWVKTETGFYPKFSIAVKQFPIVNAKELNSIIDERCV